MYLGAHIGVAEGLPEAVAQGKKIGCEAIQIFSKSPQMWKGPPVAPEAARLFREAVVREGLRATAVHHGYLINLASPKAPALRQSRIAFLDEIQRAELLGVDGLIFHPGAHLGSGVEAGLATIAESLNGAIEATPGGKVRLLLENAAGQGTTLCSTFEELAQVLARVRDRGRVGVTLDTCHLFAMGVDFRTDDGYASMIDRLESALGVREVRAFHLNDAKADLGSHLDRHENIGKGQIGVDGFRHLVNDPRWASLPGYLETPLDAGSYGRYAEDLTTLRSLSPAPAVPAGPARRRGARARPSSTVK